MSKAQFLRHSKQVMVVVLWLIPFVMTVLWYMFHTEIFGKPPPFSSVAKMVIDVLFTVNFVLLGLFLFLSRGNMWASVLIAILQLIVTTPIWFFSGMSLSGYYF
jgi:cadmium resistance protein CadD (predicted permease)